MKEVCVGCLQVGDDVITVVGGGIIMVEDPCVVLP